MYIYIYTVYIIIFIIIYYYYFYLCLCLQASLDLSNMAATLTYGSNGSKLCQCNVSGNMSVFLLTVHEAVDLLSQLLWAVSIASVIRSWVPWGPWGTGWTGHVPPHLLLWTDTKK